MPRSTKHWHAMNGSSGCMPDSNVVCSSEEDAIESLCNIFSDLDIKEIDEMRASLGDGITYHFVDPCEAGADYCYVTECYEVDCLKEEG